MSPKNKEEGRCQVSRAWTITLKISSAGELFATPEHSGEAMRNCFSTSRISLQRSWDHRSLRTSQRIVSPRTLAVKQLSNTELLEILRQEKEDATCTATAQTNPNVLDPQEHDIFPQGASLLATHVPPLPQSPLTDEGLSAARKRYRAVKPMPFGNRSPFQLKLQKNPYGIRVLIGGPMFVLTSIAALALATPPRLCVLTDLRLPSYFQIPFGVATHPKTGAPWHLPKLPTQVVSHPDDDESPIANPEETRSSLLKPDDASATLESPVRILSSTHFLASRQVLAHVSGLAPAKYKNMMPIRWRLEPSVKVHDIIWREDMDTLVLDILRRNVSITLSYLASRPAAYITPCKSYKSIDNHVQVAAVLWLRNSAITSTHGESSNGGAASLDSGETGPPPYAMHYHKARYIPCYNLAALLGPTQLSALQESWPGHYSDQLAVIKLKRNTIKVQLELWKLLGYIVRDGGYG